MMVWRNISIMSSALNYPPLVFATHMDREWYKIKQKQPKTVKNKPEVKYPKLKLIIKTQ